MSLSSVSPPNRQSTNQIDYTQIAQNFAAIGTALQSGSLSSAQSALAAFQQSLPGSSQGSNSQPFGKNSQANSDYQNMVSALQSGNLSSAQQSYNSLKSDLNAAHGHRHHHRSSGAASANTSTSGGTSNTAGASASAGTVSLPGRGTTASATSGSGNGSLLNVLA